MMVSFFRSFITIASIFYGLNGCADEGQPKWSSEQIMRFKGIGEVVPSPDGKSVVFVVNEAVMTEDKDRFCTRLYRVDSEGKNEPLPFTQAESSAVQPRWSPDGKWIAFISDRAGVKALYAIRTDGGEATLLVRSKHPVNNFRWSPDSRTIAFVMPDETDEARDHKPFCDAYVYKVDRKVNRLWIVDVFSPETTFKPLTSDDYYVRGVGDLSTINEEFDWSPDGKFITFAYTIGSGLDYFYRDSSIATVDVATRTTVAWDKQAQFEGSPLYSPDGKWIAYLASEKISRYDMHNKIVLRTSDGKQMRQLSPTQDEGRFLRGPNLLGWTEDGKNILFFEPKKTKFHLVLLPVDGSGAKELASGDWFFKEPVVSCNRKTLGMVIQSPSTPPEAYVTRLDRFEPKKLSNLNKALLSLPTLTTEVLQWKSTDGLQIEGLVTYPVNYQKGKKYPLLVVVHGGPIAFYDEMFVGTPSVYPLASFAQEGFVVLRHNPRGSSGYGREFRELVLGDWGGMDYQDLMSGVDFLIDKGIVDAQNLGILGWSYGGYMTARTITQTNRFKAASMGAGLCNLASVSGTTDLHHFLFDNMAGDFWKKSALYQERSPVYYVENVTTPLLIQHGVEDVRVPISQSYEFYHALKREGKDVTMVIYPRMGHGIGEPKMEVDLMDRNLKWFKEHLQEDYRNGQ